MIDNKRRSVWGGYGLWRVLPLALVAACGNAPVTGLPQRVDPRSTRCAPGVAQIQVADNFFRILCGCTGADEVAGTLFEIGAPLSCELTPPQNGIAAQVTFYFAGVSYPHQIVSTGPVSFGATPLYDARFFDVRLPFSMVFPQANTAYTFSDINGHSGVLKVP